MCIRDRIQAVRFRRLQQRHYLPPASALAEYGNISGIPPKGGNIFPYPFQRGNDIIAACVAGILVALPIGRQIQIAQYIEPVIDGYHHHIAQPAHILPFIGRLLDGGACRVAASVQPYHCLLYTS